MSGSLRKSSGFEEGQLVRDKNPKSDNIDMVVIDITNKRSDTVVINWDWNMNEVMVSDQDYNKQNHSPEDEVIKVVYKNQLDKRFPRWEKKGGIDYVKSLVEQDKLKAYSFPFTRLNKIR